MEFSHGSCSVRDEMNGPWRVSEGFTRFLEALKGRWLEFCALEVNGNL